MVFLPSAPAPHAKQLNPIPSAPLKQAAASTITTTTGTITTAATIITSTAATIITTTATTTETNLVCHKPVAVESLFLPLIR